MVAEVIWWILAAGIVASAAGVVFSRSVTHAAIFLILALGGVAAMYIMLHNPFLALVQVLIYAGAVAVLLLLALMVTRQAEPSGRPASLTGGQWPFAIVAAAAIAVVIAFVAFDPDWAHAADEPAEIGIGTISEVLFERFGVPFLIASGLLLVALIGAIMLGRADDTE